MRKLRALPSLASIDVAKGRAKPSTRRDMDSAWVSTCSPRTLRHGGEDTNVRDGTQRQTCGAAGLSGFPSRVLAPVADESVSSVGHYIDHSHQQPMITRLDGSLMFPIHVYVTLALHQGAQ